MLGARSLDSTVSQRLQIRPGDGVAMFRKTRGGLEASQTRRTIKGNEQPAGEVHSTLSTPGTKTQCVLLGASRATGKTGLCPAYRWHSDFLSESSERVVCEPEITHRTHCRQSPHVHTSAGLSPRSHFSSFLFPCLFQNVTLALGVEQC